VSQLTPKDTMQAHRFLQEQAQFEAVGYSSMRSWKDRERSVNEQRFLYSSSRVRRWASDSA
jgi:hypothetical protein